MVTPSGLGREEEHARSELLDFYRALCHPARLKIAGTLALAPATIPELARRCGEPVASMPRHLALMVGCGLVLVRDDGRFALDAEKLRERAKGALDSPRSRARAGAPDERGRLLANLFRDGRLTVFPTGDQRKLLVLGEIATRFDAARTYTEPEVNAVLKALYDDYTTLRRALVDFRFMNRDRGVYWLCEDPPAGVSAGLST